MDDRRKLNEQAFIGNVLQDQRLLSAVLERLRITHEMFKDSRHFTIMRAVLDIYHRDDGTKINFITVNNELKSPKDSRDSGGTIYILDIISTVITPSKETTFNAANAIYADWSRDQLHGVAREIDMSMNAGMKIDTTMDEVSRRMEFIKSAQLSNEPRGHVFDIAMQVLKNAEDYQTRIEKGLVMPFSWGSEMIDAGFGNPIEGDLIVVAARPGMGKTALMLQTILSIAQKGDPFLFWSLDMSKDQVVTRIISKLSGVRVEAINGGKFTKEEHHRMHAAAGLMKELPIIVRGRPNMGSKELSRETKAICKSEGIRAVGLDYLTKIRVDNKDYRIGLMDVLNEITNNAKEFNVPYFLLSQIGRGVETGNAEFWPTLRDLQETGAIEQMADIVMMLYRPVYYEWQKTGYLENFYKEACQSRLGMQLLKELVFIKKAKGRNGYGEENIHNLPMLWDGASGDIIPMSSEYLMRKYDIQSENRVADSVLYEMIGMEYITNKSSMKKFIGSGYNPPPLSFSEPKEHPLAEFPL